MYPQLVEASSLKPELVAGLDILIVRELTGGIYFGEPRGIRTLDNGEREGFNTYRYSESEIRRIGHLAFTLARKRGGRLCSVDKANVLEATVLWREVISEHGRRLSRCRADAPVRGQRRNAAGAGAEAVRRMVTGNMFGDILSDAAAMLTGSIGMLPSASLDAEGRASTNPATVRRRTLPARGWRTPWRRSCPWP
jgi:3-isopropylmalate dehydrogenase